VIDVWSRLWPSTVVGKRSYRNTLDLFQDLSNRMNPEVTPLITTDGFKFYERVIGRVFGPTCVYGQVIKTRRNDRAVTVERRAVIVGNLLIEAAFYGVQECLVGAIRNGTAGQFPCSGNPSGGLATVDDGSTFM
jgi:hypothetical protein